MNFLVRLSSLGTIFHTTGLLPNAKQIFSQKEKLIFPTVGLDNFIGLIITMHHENFKKEADVFYAITVQAIVDEVDSYNANSINSDRKKSFVQSSLELPASNCDKSLSWKTSEIR